MSTSGSTDFNLTRDEIITEALENIGVLDIGDDPETNDVTSMARSLNLLVKSLHADPFIQLRFVGDETLALSDGTGSYSLESDTHRVLSFRLRIDSEDIPLDMISKEQYDLIVSKSEENQPQRVYIDYAPSTPVAYFNPVPGASYTAIYTRERRIEDFDASTDNADLPVEAVDMLILGLSARGAEKFGLPSGERAYWHSRYEASKREYRAGNTNRHGRETIAPSNVV